MCSNHAASTHVVFSRDDLLDLKQRLGLKHAIYQRVRKALAELNDPGLVRYRAAAEQHARDGELEIDAGAVVSKGDDNGAYVMAWLWIHDDELAPAEVSNP